MKSNILIFLLLLMPRAMAFGCEKLPFADWRWQQRLLLLQVQASHREALEQAIEDERGALEERRLRVLFVDESGVEEYFPAPGNYCPLSSGELSRAMVNNASLLIGLDGGIKHRFDVHHTEWPALYVIIDAMPMRRAELRGAAQER